MTTTEAINHLAGLGVRCSMLEMECAALREKLAAREAQAIDTTRFELVAMTTEEVARFHGVSTIRVRDYAHRGLIPQHPNSTDGKMLFRASDILKLDFGELKKAKKILTR